ncbi:MAG: DUF934 domain-containing protein [Pseudomonadota bacterium]
MLLDASGPIVDHWTNLDDPEFEIQQDGQVIVPLHRLGQALERRAATGVLIPNDADLEELKPFFNRLDLIAVDFPSFADGRGFSIAVRLRDLGYRGRLRAHGPVIADQFAYLLDCGFDEAWVPDAVADRQPAEQWLAQLGKITHVYQRGRPGQRSILDQRRDARVSAG